MPLNETMQNYNRNNPFVIICKDLRDEIDQTAFDLTKLLLTILILLTIQTALPAAILPAAILISDGKYNLAIGIAYIVLLVLWIYFVMSFNYYRKGLIRNGAMDEVDQILNREQGEILNSNNETLMDTIRKMERLEGAIEGFDRSMGLFKHTLYCTLILEIFAGGIYLWSICV